MSRRLTMPWDDSSCPRCRRFRTGRRDSDVPTATYQQRTARTSTRQLLGLTDPRKASWGARRLGRSGAISSTCQARDRGREHGAINRLADVPLISGHQGSDSVLRVRVRSDGDRRQVSLAV
jgi:hypothetical protein